MVSYVGCGATADSCAGLRTAARESIQSVIDANLACTNDADCKSVALGASCFDSCARAMATSGQGQYEAAVDSANRSQCKEYNANACPSMVIPPCVPPTPPACVSGKCT